MCTEKYNRHGARVAHTHASTQPQPREPEPATQAVVAGETIAKDAITASNNAPSNDDTAEHATIPAPAEVTAGAAGLLAGSISAAPGSEA